MRVFGEFLWALIRFLLAILAMVTLLGLLVLVPMGTLLLLGRTLSNPLTAAFVAIALVIWLALVCGDHGKRYSSESLDHKFAVALADIAIIAGLMIGIGMLWGPLLALTASINLILGAYSWIKWSPWDLPKFIRV